MNISWTRAALAAICAALCSACGNSRAQPDVVAEARQSERARMPGEYIVALAADATTNAIIELYAGFTIKSIKPLGNNVYLVELSQDPGPAAIESLGRSNVHIKAVQPNYGYRTQRK